MNNKVYFGTRDRMRWVKAPAVNTPLSKVGWSSNGTDLNGGGFSKNSPTAHREYEFSWGASPAQDIYDILDYRSGAYGLGPLYYLDPFAMRTNAFSEAFSMPNHLCAIGRMGGTYSTPTGSRIEATNLFTNPRAVTTGLPVEVWRNLETNPAAVEGGSAWTSNQMSDVSWGVGSGLPDGFPDTYRRGITTVRSGAGFYRSRTGMYAGGEGSALTLSVMVRLSAEGTVGLSLEGSKLPVPLRGPAVLIPANVWTEVRHTFTLPVLNTTGTETAVLYTVDIASAPPIGTVMDQTAGTIGPNMPYGSGSETTDPDLIPSWTGPVNNSPNVLTGMQVTGISGGGGRFNIQSSESFGGSPKSVRIIRTGTVTQSNFGAIVGGIPAGSLVTVAAYCHVPEGYDPSDDTEVSRSIYCDAQDGTILVSGKAPATPGTHLVRSIIQLNPIASNVRLAGGGLVGQSLHWTTITTAPGNHPDLMPFSGATRDLNGSNGRWTGTPDNSTSELFTDINSPAYPETQQPLPVTIVSAASTKQYIPLPENHSMWVAYGATGNVLQGNGTALTATSPDDSAMFWNRINQSTEFQWVGSATVWGAVCLVLPTGQTPEPNQQWVPGRGASGLAFKGEPQVTGLSAVYGDNGGLLNASASLIETELWSNA